jgi:hypothetical protein
LISIRAPLFGDLRIQNFSLGEHLHIGSDGFETIHPVLMGNIDIDRPPDSKEPLGAFLQLRASGQTCLGEVKLL